MTTEWRCGVWLADIPLDVNEGASGDTLIRVTLPLGRRTLSEFEVVEELKPYREWQLPAELVNRFSTSKTIISLAREQAIGLMRPCLIALNPATRGRKRGLWPP